VCTVFIYLDGLSKLDNRYFLAFVPRHVGSVQTVPNIVAAIVVISLVVAAIVVATNVAGSNIVAANISTSTCVVVPEANIDDISFTIFTPECQIIDKAFVKVATRVLYLSTWQF